jgi:hypothetical protein
MLKTLLTVYCNTGYLNVLLEVLQNPGGLRLPRRLEQVVSASTPIVSLAAALREDGWADLGFLTLAVRKMSSRLEEQGRIHVTGKPLVILGSTEADGFSALATALQAYAHDKPSALETRAENLRTALQSLRVTTDAIRTRDALPDQMLVTENCTDLIGPVFRGITSDGRVLTLVADQAPQLGQRILYIAALKRDLSSCIWCECPWPALSERR